MGEAGNCPPLFHINTVKTTSYKYGFSVVFREPESYCILEDLGNIPKTHMYQA